MIFFSPSTKCYSIYTLAQSEFFFFSFNLFISLTIIWHQLNNQLTQYQGIFIKIIYQGKVNHILQLWMGTTSGSIMFKNWRYRFRFSNDLILKSLILSCLYSTSLKPLMWCINFNTVCTVVSLTRPRVFWTIRALNCTVHYRVLIQNLFFF